MVQGDVDDVIAELRRRAEAAEAFVGVLTEQLRSAEKRDVEAQDEVRGLRAVAGELDPRAFGEQRGVTRRDR